MIALEKIEVSKNWLKMEYTSSSNASTEINFEYPENKKTIPNSIELTNLTIFINVAKIKKLSQLR